MSTRRAFLSALAGGLALPRARAEAQPPANASRIGYLAVSPLKSPETRSILDAFRQGLREYKYVEGQNLVIEYRSAEGKLEMLPGAAAELVRLNVALIVAPSTPTVRAAREATSTTPIVAVAMGNPVGDGLVQSLARPGGNVTGLTFLGPELVPKRLALLKEALPKASRVAALWHPGSFSERTSREMVKETESAARRLGIQLRLVEVRSPDDFDRAFSTIAAERADSLFVFPSTLLFNHRRRIIDLVTRQRLPSMYPVREFVDIGGLMSYGTSIPDLSRRAAGYVDRILKGAKPGDLPVEQPSKFEFVMNLKTAGVLGLVIPPKVLGRADEVIR